MGRYSKAIAAAIVAILTAVQPLLGHGWDRNTWLSIILAVCGAVAVYVVPELPGGAVAYAKGTVAVLVAIAQTLMQFAAGPLTSQEIVTVVLAVLGALGVAAAPNRAATPSPPASMGPPRAA